MEQVGVIKLIAESQGAFQWLSLLLLLKTPQNEGCQGDQDMQVSWIVPVSTQ